MHPTLTVDPKDFVTVNGLKVYSRKWTKKEEYKILDDAYLASKRNDRAEYGRLARLLPLHLELANDMREEMGLEKMIQRNVNFYNVLEKCGEQWFK